MNYQKEIEMMEEYILQLKKDFKENPKLAKQKAIESLIVSGLFNLDGTPKKEICNNY